MRGADRRGRAGRARRSPTVGKDGISQARAGRAAGSRKRTAVAGYLRGPPATPKEHSGRRVGCFVAPRGSPL
eukprot:scaffold5337_cov411-Prasinococcus_capsulatus_cf.AAC.5